MSSYTDAALIAFLFSQEGVPTNPGTCLAVFIAIDSRPASLEMKSILQKSTPHSLHPMPAFRANQDVMCLSVVEQKVRCVTVNSSMSVCWSILDPPLVH